MSQQKPDGVPSPFPLGIIYGCGEGRIYLVFSEGKCIFKLAREGWLLLLRRDLSKRSVFYEGSCIEQKYCLCLVDLSATLLPW